MVNVCTKIEKPVSILCLVIIPKRCKQAQHYGHIVEDHCDLDLCPINLRVKRDHLLSLNELLFQFCEAKVKPVSSYDSGKL